MREVYTKTEIFQEKIKKLKTNRERRKHPISNKRIPNKPKPFNFLTFITLITKVKTFATLGLQGHEIIVEGDTNNALPSIEIIGLPDAAIRESKERLRATFRNVGIQLPRRKFVLNLSPSDIRKVGTSFDLAMAVAILLIIQWEDCPHLDRLNDYLFFWELGLDGEIKRVNGLLPCVLSALKQGYTHFFIPADNIYELEYIPGITIYPIKRFAELVAYLVQGGEIQMINQAKDMSTLAPPQEAYGVDFAHIKGQLLPKRALAIAAAGLHNIVMIGAPGSGKTMLSKAVQSILPPLNFEEILEVSQIYSVVGKLHKDQPLITQRPFRQVHHTASKISLTGGGSMLTPGEVSLAHKGILFLDELTEFPREVLEVLRQPVEDKEVIISRVSGTISYPANVMLVAAMNPCKCGYHKDPEKPCLCSLHDIKKYQSKISGPLLDRIDMIIEIPREQMGKILTPQQEESSQLIKERVLRARKIQQERFAGTEIRSNAQMQAKHLEQYVPLDDSCKEFLIQAAQKLTLSPRVVHRTIKLARTIADMDNQEHITLNHLAEAMQYRSKTMFVEE